MMGEVINLATDGPAELSGVWNECPPNAQLCLIVDGKTRERFAAAGNGSRGWQIAEGEGSWCLLTLREENGQMLALTNPIYLDGRA